jgi:hypothetical protein
MNSKSKLMTGSGFNLTIHRNENRECWYDPRTRMWAMQIVNSDGDLIGYCRFGKGKKAVMKWLETGIWK